jgi:hypothetical protein
MAAGGRTYQQAEGHLLLVAHAVSPYPPYSSLVSCSHRDWAKSSMPADRIA